MKNNTYCRITRNTETGVYGNGTYTIRRVGNYWEIRKCTDVNFRLTASTLRFAKELVNNLMGVYLDRNGNATTVYIAKEHMEQTGDLITDVDHVFIDVDTNERYTGSIATAKFERVEIVDTLIGKILQIYVTTEPVDGWDLMSEYELYTCGASYGRANLALGTSIFVTESLGSGNGEYTVEIVEGEHRNKLASFDTLEDAIRHLIHCIRNFETECGNAEAVNDLKEYRELSQDGRLSYHFPVLFGLEHKTNGEQIFVADLRQYNYVCEQVYTAGGM